MEPRFKSHLRTAFGADADALQRAMEHVEAMMATPGWRLVQEILGAERSELDRELDNPNRVLEHASYALKHGYRAGLNASEQAARTLVEYAAEELERQRRIYEGVPAVPGSRREGSNG